MPLNVLLTCDWEGRKEPEKKYYPNFRRLRKYMDQIGLGDIPVTHFITPRAYGPGLAKVIEERQIILPQDEIGLHIHCWNDLIEVIDGKSDGPLSQELKGLQQKYHLHHGKDVPLCDFKPQSIESIVKFYKETLESWIKRSVTSFRGGGWFTGDDVYRALSKFGIIVDSSPIPPKLKAFDQSFPRLAQRLQELWGKEKANFGNAMTAKKVPEAIGEKTKPYLLDQIDPNIQILPDNLGMDVTGLPLAGVGAAIHSARQGASAYATLGFHDSLIGSEWCAWQLPVQNLLLGLAKSGLPVNFLTATGAAKQLVQKK